MGAAPTKKVASCATCPFAMVGEEWHPFCEAPQRGRRPARPPRRLPKDHDPDGPPPKWCPLPLIVERA